ncbi:Extracellular matrix protein 2 [Fukomys damarensis]|uniref:Extracellular matrix protein 2 n=1 Tax=Fukomys damarensis TaxID=885580 RepID=A0A091E8X8_FUKDA|nr:Extracellular matrix protein 2 [Fukomys damarensis]
MKHVPALTDPDLTTFYLAENEIATIMALIFLGLPNLEWLDLSKNKVDSQGLHRHAFWNLTRPMQLNLDGNILSTVPALPTSLQELKLNDNLLPGPAAKPLLGCRTWDGLGGLSQLLVLEAEGNQLHDGNISPLAFQPLPSLLYLRLDQNRLRAIPPGLPASLQELHLASNLIEEVTEKLETLDLSYNRLVHVPFFLLQGLQHPVLHHSLIEHIPGYVFAHLKPGLEFLHLSHNKLRADGSHAMSFWGLHASLAELLPDHNQPEPQDQVGLCLPRGLWEAAGGSGVIILPAPPSIHVPLNSICDTCVARDSNLIFTHLENIDPRHIPPTAFTCIWAYCMAVLQPQQVELLPPHNPCRLPQVECHFIFPPQGEISSRPRCTDMPTSLLAQWRSKVGGHRFGVKHNKCFLFKFTAAFLPPGCKLQALDLTCPAVVGHTLGAGWSARSPEGVALQKAPYSWHPLLLEPSVPKCPHPGSAQSRPGTHRWAQLSQQAGTCLLF